MVEVDYYTKIDIMKVCKQCQSLTRYCIILMEPLENLLIKMIGTAQVMKEAALLEKVADLQARLL